jgi:molybdate/tungstate transport system substrate-binding protein
LRRLPIGAQDAILPHKVAAALVAVACAAMGGCGSHSNSGKTLVIYHHGSPTPAIEAAQKVFEAKYPDIKVLREKDDALANMRKVTDLGKFADIVYTDDYSIIPPVMFPKYADFWISYAHDKMTLAYAANSKFAAEVNAGNWYKILQRPGVKWGIADPNAGPDGYFSLGQIMLSNIYYKSDIFKDLVAANTAITATESGGRYIVDCPDGSGNAVSDDPGGRTRLRLRIHGVGHRRGAGGHPHGRSAAPGGSLGLIAGFEHL